MIPWSWGQVPEQGDEFQAVDSGDLKIRDDDLERCPTALAQSFFSVFGDERLVTRSFEDGAQNDPS